MNAISADAGQLKAHSRSIHWVYIWPGTRNSQPILPTVPYRGGRLQGLDLQQMLSWAWDLVAAFRPQSNHRRMVSCMSKATFLKQETLRGRFGMSLNPDRVCVKDERGQWLRKRDIMKEFKRLLCNGGFMAKNQWRITNSFSLNCCPTDGTQVREFRGQVEPNPGGHLGPNGCRLMVRASEDTTWKHGILAIRDIQKIRGTVFWGPHNKDPTM